MLTMTRRVTFSAGKVDWTALDGFEGGPEPVQPYGHNYVVDVTLSGEIDPRTGIIVNIKEIDRIVRERVVDRLHKKLIHVQAPEFCMRPVSPESLAVWIAGALRAHMPEEAKLVSVRVEETPEQSAEWRDARSDMDNPSNQPFARAAGDAAPSGSGRPDRSSDRAGDPAAEQARVSAADRSVGNVLRATRVYEFAASHRLHSDRLSAEENRELFGKCNYESGHGHNYILEVTVEGPIDEQSGRVIDPDELDAIVNREVVDRYDHRHFNIDIPEFQGLIPSTEMVTKVVWDRLAGKIPTPARLASVLIRETARNIFEYRGEA
ncbi:MAG TPA: 6-carboxytetrahydropterin synthase [Chthonomonadaceae bacterium]|nr:6-carboxytetrahydropterin synthase [Chthonomonadaceae bacterium]